MPVIEYFPYMGPNRRTHKTVVEITLRFNSDHEGGFPIPVSEARKRLIEGAILTR